MNRFNLQPTSKHIQDPQDVGENGPDVVKSTTDESQYSAPQITHDGQLKQFTGSPLPKDQSAWNSTWPNPGSMTDRDDSE